MARHDLHLSHNGTTYKFLTYEFRDHADGSFLLFFNRNSKGDEQVTLNHKEGTIKKFPGRSGPFRITYHSSGKVNYHNSSANYIYCDPIFDISHQQLLALISIPSFDSLTKADKISPDTIFINGVNKRITFYILILPADQHIHNFSIEITYSPWFKIVITEGQLPFQLPKELENHTITCAADPGCRDKQYCDKHNAKFLFQQKRMGQYGPMVCMWTPQTGQYRILLKNPMRAKPNISVEFLDKTIFAEIDITRGDEREIWFWATRKNRRIKNKPFPITGLTLDADFRY